MLRVSSLSKAFGGDPVLEGISFVLNPGERVGLVGPNGAGKSTLLQVIAGNLASDSGSVWADPVDSVAYLPQYPLDELHLTARESLLLGLGDAAGLEREIAQLESRMASAPGEELERLLELYAEARERFERMGGYELDARIGEITQGLALSSEDLARPLSMLSGGTKTKLLLARLLLSGASILLLDEPTNYLDLPSLLWLERFVQENSASFIIVSHDRRFLDRTVTSILELDPTRHTLRVWPGNYTDYAEAKEVERRKQLEAYLDRQEEIERVEGDIRRTKEQARSVERATKLDTTRRYAKKVAKKAKARERRLERSLEEQTIEKPERSWGLHLADLGKNPIDDNRTVLKVEDLRAGYGDRKVLRGVALELHGRDRAVLLGGNGGGKSTLIRCITSEMRFEGEAQLGSGVRLGTISQEGAELPLDKSPLEVLRSRMLMYEDEARTYLHKFLFAGDEVLKPVRALSYGQRAKLALAVLVLSDANLLLLDEPTSHMDLAALEAMEQALREYVGPLLLVSHDRYFIDRVGVNKVLVMEQGLVRQVESMEAYESEVMVNA